MSKDALLMEKALSISLRKQSENSHILLVLFMNAGPLKPHESGKQDMGIKHETGCI